MNAAQDPAPDLERDTAVTGSDGRYTATISPEWCVWSPQGGYLMAMAMRGFGLATAFPVPFSFTCHFLAVPKVGAVELQATSLRKTRSAESLRLSMVQDGRVFLEAMLWAGEAAEGYEHAGAEMPVVPALETLASTPIFPGAGGFHTLWKNLEMRPCGPPASQRQSPAEPRQRDWMRLRSYAPSRDAYVEAARHAMFLDTFTWPAASHAHVGDPRFITPTLSFAIDFHRTSDSAWLLSDAHSPDARDGRMAIHDRLWSPTGELVASATGTMVCRPRPPALR